MERAYGPKLPLEHMVAGQTRRTAETVDLLDRGLVAAGYRDGQPTGALPDRLLGGARAAPAALAAE